MRIMTGIFGESHADYDGTIWRKVSIEKNVLSESFFGIKENPICKFFSMDT